MMTIAHLTGELKIGTLSGPIGIKEGQKFYVFKSWQYGYQIKGLDMYSQNICLTVSFRTPETLWKGSKRVKMIRLTINHLLQVLTTTV